MDRTRSRFIKATRALLAAFAFNHKFKLIADQTSKPGMFLPRVQAAGVARDDFVVKAALAGLVFGDNLRFERNQAVTRDVIGSEPRSPFSVLPLWPLRVLAEVFLPMKNPSASLGVSKFAF
jgi:hypothetical protein